MFGVRYPCARYMKVAKRIAVAAATGAISVKANVAGSRVDTGACVTAILVTHGVSGRPQVIVDAIAIVVLNAPTDERVAAVPMTTDAKARSRLRLRKAV